MIFNSHIFLDRPEYFICSMSFVRSFVRSFVHSFIHCVGPQRVLAIINLSIEENTRSYYHIIYRQLVFFTGHRSLFYQ